ncbi:PREDICTED: sphingomyelin phosphodiesterase-like isoform X3 [Amphimedon queenslandica]|uniref:Sphingomyelin phosphodiesterase n=1 Tax=Amphimedon queenslandica TaxID=400682 RepID=A0AAN0JE98_AMPQE|nr:PREDICTED: sphingomyelin phosphodiesterase-like isoform X3 [Amphimedon queenslandica]|eukprot:XP_019855309.1 PREDICTED: sphingomyelin phosphodiesterase-like isoform X3 [Amphimedon queenslandica]
MKGLLGTVLVLLIVFRLNQPVQSASLKGITSGIADSVLCEACTVIVDTIQKLAEFHFSESLIEKAAIEACEKFKLADDRICKLIIPEFKDEVLYVFDHTALSTREVCGTILDDKCGTTYDPFNQEWTVPVPGGKPPLVPYQPPKVNITNRILHISDIHWDPQYTPGLQARCDEPLCCRPPLPKGDPNNSAGAWGDAHCDIPLQTVVNLMEHLNATQDQFEWIYMTGDLPAHNDWSQTRSGQVDIFNKMIDLFNEYLPNKPVFYSFGNHESDPVNSFPPNYITGSNSISWLYDDAADKLKKWLNTTDAYNTFKSGGYYSVDYNGIRIISLQTNYCNKQNWWLLINGTDPDGMLQWFVEKLLDAEKKGMKVHVLGHISPGDGADCSNAWSANYKKIALRFESTIAGQFFGHCHEDRFHLMVDFEANTPPRPYGILYLGPSVTTYTEQNPGYRIYTVDGNYNGSSRQVLDHDTYILNITDANLTNKPKWIHEYSAKDAYNMTNLTPDSWLSLLKEFLKNNTLFLKYYHYFFKSYNMESQCNGNCQKQNTCNCLTTFSSIYACHAITEVPLTKEEIYETMLYEKSHDHC